jgi:Fe2+ or Zn2+ uptake regulation protein
MSQIEGTIRCDGCGIEISLSPVVFSHRHYCCQDCANGMTCDCADQVELDELKSGKSDFDLKMDLYV